MPAKVRRIDRDAVSPFEWQSRAVPSTDIPPSTVESAPDAHAQQLNLANLERDAF